MLRLIDSAKLPNVSTRFLDASKLEGVEDEIFVIQFLSNSQSVDNGMCRVLKPGGVLGWDKENDIFIAWGKACRAVDPSYEVLKS